MSDPIVTVGLPITKTEYLREAIACLNNQSFVDFELIVLNNGKTPEIRTQIRSIFNEIYTGNNFRYFENEIQLPIIENWNKCLSYASGEFFILFSDDDIYHPDFIKEMVALSNKIMECNLFHCRIFQIDGDGKIIGISQSCPEHENVLDFMWHRICKSRMLFLQEFMCRTKNLKEIGGYYNLPLAWGSDDTTWYLIAREGGVAYSNKVLCYWRSSNFNLSTIGDIKLRINSVNMYYSFIHSFINEFAARSTEDKFLIQDIDKHLPRYVSAHKESLLLRYLHNSSFLRTIFLAFRYKLKKEISFETFILVFLKSLYSKLGKRTY